jgi:hypothetical protein
MPETGDAPPPAPTPPPRRKRAITDWSWIGTPQHFDWLELVVKALLILNVIDAVMTVAWIYSGHAVEANPLIAGLAHEQPVIFVLVKTVLVSLGSWLLWRQRRQPLAVVAIFGVFLAYYFLVIYHLKALDLQLMSRLFD